VNLLDIDSVRRRLPGRRIDWYEHIASTMPAAAVLPPGSAVVAEEQTAGHGRHGHSWHSAAGCGLYCSIVLQPAFESGPPPVLTLALGLAVVEAIARVSDLRCDLRWPNDVMIADRKAAGILVQMTGLRAIAGIGINVNHTEFPEPIAHLATSLRLAAGRELSREDLLCALLGSVDSFAKMLVQSGPEKIIELFTRYSTYARGKHVEVDQPEGMIRGVTAGLDQNGFLKVCRDDGVETLVLAGGVRAIGA
jgi:BirA family biotin operon repressor/biotin-[acetyl-CoA-carboxylase] ligase